MNTESDRSLWLVSIDDSPGDGLNVLRITCPFKGIMIDPVSGNQRTVDEDELIEIDFQESPPPQPG